MSGGVRLPLAQAARLAELIRERLVPACDRIEVAGSIRRRAPEVGDIEFLAIPKLVDGVPRDLFSSPPRESLLDVVLQVLATEGRLVAHPTDPKNGDRYKKLWAPRAGVQVDLFVALDSADWGPLFFIRTGPAAFSHRAVTELQRLDLRCHERGIWRGNERLPCPEEQDFFRLLDWPYLEPWERR